MDLLKFLVFPLSPYSYYKLNPAREGIVDKYIADKQYNIIACRYIGEAINLGLNKYRSRLVIDVDDNIVSMLLLKGSLQNFSNPISKLVWKFRAHAAGIMQKHFLSKVKCSFYSNKYDSPYKHSVYLHNSTMVNSDQSLISSETPFVLLVVGHMDYSPNYLGVRHFVENIFPLVNKKYPSAELKIIGKISYDKKQYLQQFPNVKILGFVDDVIHEYNESRVIIVPLYHGSGTSVKFIEAAAMKRPIVSTEIGRRGLDYAFENGTDYFLAEDDASFAEKIIVLLSSIEKSNEMAIRAAQKVYQYFSRDLFYETVKSAIMDV